MNEPKHWKLAPADGGKLKACPDPECNGIAYSMETTYHNDCVGCTATDCTFFGIPREVWQRLPREGEPERGRTLLWLYRSEEGDTVAYGTELEPNRYRTLLGTIDITDAVGGDQSS